MTIEQLLEDFERKTKFSGHQICKAIENLSDAENERFESQAEVLAMSFSDNGGDIWGTYYGPTITFQRNSDGKNVYRPDKAKITSSHIEYWKKRAAETNNALLKMRYTGLVCDFEQLVTGEKPDFKTAQLANIQAIMDVVEQDMPEFPYAGIVFSEHGITKAIRLGQTELTEKFIKVLLAYEKKYAQDVLPGIWETPFQMMLEHRNHFLAFEKDMLKEHEERFRRLEKNCHEQGHVTDKFVHCLQEQAKLLAAYYHKFGDSAKVSDYLERSLHASMCSKSLRGSIWGMQTIEIFQGLYRKFNLDGKANALYLDMQKNGGHVLKEMTPHVISLPVDQSDLDKYFCEMLQGSKQDIISNFLTTYIPRIAIEKKRQAQEGEAAPLMDMIHTVVFDWAGMPIAHISTGENAEKGKLSYGIYRRMLIKSPLIGLHIKKMKEKDFLTSQSVYELFQGSPLILDGQKGIFERAINAYFDHDYVVACHLLVTMYESAIRTLAAMLGIEVMSANRNGGNEYKSLDVLIEKIKEYNASSPAEYPVPQDIFDYYQSVFTDKLGWNARNLICHGLLQSEAYNETLANRIFHAFLTLSLIKFTRVQQ